MLFEKNFILVFEVFSLLQTEASDTEFLLNGRQVTFKPVDFSLVEINIVFGGGVIVNFPFSSWSNSGFFDGFSLRLAFCWPISVEVLIRHCSLNKIILSFKLD